MVTGEEAEMMITFFKLVHAKALQQVFCFGKRHYVMLCEWVLNWNSLKERLDSYSGVGVSLTLVGSIKKKKFVVRAYI